MPLNTDMDTDILSDQVKQYKNTYKMDLNLKGEI
jgi:hypothetical protein